jgi:hypothetical protein
LVAAAAAEEDPVEDPAEELEEVKDPIADPIDMVEVVWGIADAIIPVWLSESALRTALIGNRVCVSRA